jgi:hypothetical protein
MGNTTSSADLSSKLQTLHSTDTSHSRCLTQIGVQHRYDTNTYGYIQLFYFLKFLSVSTFQCHVCVCVSMSNKVRSSFFLSETLNTGLVNIFDSKYRNKASLLFNSIHFSFVHTIRHISIPYRHSGHCTLTDIEFLLICYS